MTKESSKLMAVVDLFSGFNKLMDGLQGEPDERSPRAAEDESRVAVRDSQIAELIARGRCERAACYGRRRSRFQNVSRCAALPPEQTTSGKRKGPVSKAFPRWAVPGSNQRPPACKAGALPAELTAHAPSGIRTRATALKGP